jgi:hypothetical protein
VGLPCTEALPLGRSETPEPAKTLDRIKQFRVYGDLVIQEVLVEVLEAYHGFAVAISFRSASAY